MLPGKRPHGNRIRAWGLSASRSAPILHRISSLDGVQATGEYSSPRSGLHIQHNKSGKLHGISLWGSEEETCGPKASLASRLSLLIFPCFLLQREDFGKAAAESSCDGHDDRGAGCLRLRSMAYCDRSQPVLLSAVLFARWTNRGLFHGGKCDQQTRRHDSTEVKKKNKITQLHFLPLTGGVHEDIYIYRARTLCAPVSAP